MSFPSGAQNSHRPGGRRAGRGRRLRTPRCVRNRSAGSMHVSSCSQTRCPGTFSQPHAAHSVQTAGSDRRDPPPQQALGQRSELCPGKATAVMGMGTREGCTLPERSSITAPAPSEARAPHSLQEEGIPAWLGKCTPTFNPLAPYPHSESLVTPRTEAPGV